MRYWLHHCERRFEPRQQIRCRKITQHAAFSHNLSLITHHQKGSSSVRILVTGSCGRIGQFVVADLVAAGHDVYGVDILPSAISDQHRYLRADLTDAGEAYQAVAWGQPNAVIHLAAWPNAGMVPDTRTYADNVGGTYNLFKACADLGVKRVVSASTNQIYGLAGAPPVYVPVDEAHPLRPINSYALSKIAGEQAADFFVQNHGMTILSFRFMGVRPPHQIAAEIEQMQADPASGARLLWTRTDARDAAMACRLAVEVESVESGPYNITGAQTVLNQSTVELIECYFGKRTEVRALQEGSESPLSCAKAKHAFGYAPRYVWRPNRSFED
jgi:nucleoside-diphosphate-sugar epimerase